MMAPVTKTLSALKSSKLTKNLVITIGMKIQENTSLVLIQGKIQKNK